jgi:hypothetical protein
MIIGNGSGRDAQRGANMDAPMAIIWNECKKEGILAGLKMV